MGINKGAISILLILSMVAVQVLSTGSESGKESKVFEQSASSFAKAFSTATKLDKGNYTIWIAGMLTLLIGMQGEVYEKLLLVMKGLQDKLHKQLVDIKKDACKILFGHDTPTDSSESALANKIALSIYQVVFWTIGDNLTALKTHVSTKLLFKGFETLKYVYDHYGPGCGTKQLKRQFDIMEEKQKDNETVEEFATRLQDLSSTLAVPMDDRILQQIFMKGITSVDCRKFCVGEMASATIDFTTLAEKAANYDDQDDLANGVDAFNTSVRRNNNNNGRGGAGRGGFGRGYGRGGRGNGTFNAACDFCKVIGHPWRNCFFLNKAARPANANHERMDARGAEFMRSHPPIFGRGPPRAHRLHLETTANLTTVRYTVTVHAITRH
jgi:hypothetical protein